MAVYVCLTFDVDKLFLYEWPNEKNWHIKWH